MIKRFLPLMVLAVVFSLALVACSGGTPAPAPTPQPASPPPPPPAAAPAAPAAPASPSQPAQSSGGGGTAVSVNLEDPAGSGSYVFDPADFTFSVGESVSFTFMAETEFHTFTVDDLGIDVSVDAGATQTLDFTFDEAGTFSLICIPHEALGMVGTITVQ